MIYPMERAVSGRSGGGDCRKEDAGLPLPILRFELEFQAERPFGANGYRGSAWRGVFGHALKRLVCIWRERDCPRCLVAKNCAYPYLFETPMARSNEEREELSPHPFLLEIAGEWGRRMVDRERLIVTLLGDGGKSWPYVLQAFREAGAMGFGPQKARMELQSIRQEDPVGSGQWREAWGPGDGLTVLPPSTPAIPPQPEVLRIRFATPVRLRLQQSLVSPAELTPLRFLEAVERRAGMLAKLHGEGRPAGTGRRAARWAERVRELHRNLRWQDWERFSNRQKRKILMGGVSGDWEWYLEPDWDGWELLWTFQWLHVGKGTSMGLGRYQIEVL
jgi:hypothetical protein